MLRPIERLAHEGFITYDVFSTVVGGTPLSDESILKSVKRLTVPSKTKMLICSHVPNICSAVRPIAKIGEFCRSNGILFVLDAAQSAGHVPIDMKKDLVDVLCAPGHKGLFGIQGCGIAVLGEKAVTRSIIEGGNGVDSLDWRMPSELPERLEAGTLPTPCIASLSEGIGFLSEFAPEEILFHERRLFARARDMLLSAPSMGARVYMPESEGSVLLFNIRDLPSEAVARHLSKRGICVRGGYHCSALGHKALGTLRGGAVRVSFSLFNRDRDVELLWSALKECTSDFNT